MTDTTPGTPGDDDATDYPELAPDAAGEVAARLADLDEDLAAKRADALRAGLADYDLDDDDLDLLEGATVGEDARARSSTASSAVARRSWRTLRASRATA